MSKSPKSQGSPRNIHARKPKGQRGFNWLYQNYKGNAKRKNRVFKLSKIAFKELVTKNCSYCNSGPISLARATTVKDYPHTIKHAEFPYNGIDRINNNKGYVKNNCITCCKVCNQAKHSMTQKQFYEWIDRVYSNLSQKGIVE